jgi:hypothetical protein
LDKTLAFGATVFFSFIVEQRDERRKKGEEIELLSSGELKYTDCLNESNKTSTEGYCI